MEAVLHFGTSLSVMFQSSAIFLRRHTNLLFEGTGKIAIIGETRRHAYVQHALFARCHHLAGTIEPHRVHIFLKALVQGILYKMREVADRTALCRSKIGKQGLVHIVLVHKADQSFQSGIALITATHLTGG